MHAVKPQLSIIIVHFNTFELTRRCLRSVFEFTKGITFEVLVVDNASDDGSTDLLRHEFPLVRFIVPDENIGFGAGNNEGMKSAQADVLFLLNSDTLLHDDACSTLYNFLMSSVDVHLVCCKLLNDDGTVQQSIFHGATPSYAQIIKLQCKNSPFGTLSKKVDISGAKSEFDYDLEQEIKVCSGACIMLRREVFETTLGFDPDFFMYCEETEWMRKRVNPLFRIKYTPSVSITHSAKGSGGGAANSQNRLSYFLYLYKFGMGYFRLFCLLEYLNIVLWFLVRMAALRFAEARSEAKISLQIINIARKEIPKYPNHFGARGRDLLKYRS